jgi:hypothetical protein
MSELCNCSRRQPEITHINQILHKYILERLKPTFSKENISLHVVCTQSMEQFRFKGEFAVVPTDIINNPR